MKFFYVLLGLNAIVSFVFTTWTFREEIKKEFCLTMIALFPMLVVWAVMYGNIVFFESLLGPERFDKLLKAIKEGTASIVIWSVWFMIIGTIFSGLGGLVSP